MNIRMACFASALLVLPGLAQTFNAGSNGSDGDLAFPNAKAGDVILFDPKNTAMFPGGLDKDEDGIYHFKTINIPQGVTVRLLGSIIPTPVTWLAQGDVVIAGTLDLSGERGEWGSTLYLPTKVAAGGAGGFPGGIASPFADARKGGGPGGGGVCGNQYGQPGGTTVNQFAVPLIGGGGGGAANIGFPRSGSGSGGGGAILIASSTKITLAGNVNGDGGDWSGSAGIDHRGGPGAGGTIRLAAPVVAGNGKISANAGSNASGCSPAIGTATGIIRIEAFSISSSIGIQAGTYYTASPVATYAESIPSPRVRVLTVAGFPVAALPSGSFQTPDVTFDASAEVPVVVETKNVPAGTVVALTVSSENGPSQTVNFPPLAAGGVQTLTTNVKFPTGFSRGLIRAAFTITKP